MSGTEKQARMDAEVETYCRCGDAQDVLGRCENEHCRMFRVPDAERCGRWLATHWPDY